MQPETGKVLVIVAHPDDEIIWCGGTLMNHPEWDVFILCLCRKNDPDRAPKFRAILKELGAEGIMGDLDDEPEQIPLNLDDIGLIICELLPDYQYDLIITHNLEGEYTRHRRHEEISKAVIRLLQNNKIITFKFWMFAFEDGNKSYAPTAITTADIFIHLSDAIFSRKYALITGIYGFQTTSWEATILSDNEAFWVFDPENTPNILA